MPAIAWGVVVPVKRLAIAKTRLLGYDDAARQELALAFAVDVVSAALACACVRDVVVVTDDERAATALTAAGARVVPDAPDAGLNPALAHGAGQLAPHLGAAAVSADLPSLVAADLEATLLTVPPGRRGFVPDADGTGTTMLAAAPGVPLVPSYGARSRAEHLASGAVELAGGGTLRRDVDTPADLLAAAALGVGTATSALLLRLGLAGHL